MPRLSESEFREFLDSQGVLLKIGTVGPEGMPLVTPIWFLHRDGRILFTPRRVSEWFAHIRERPEVCLCIDEQPYPYRKVIVQGRAHVLHDLGEDEQWRELYRQIARRYVDAEGADAYVDVTDDQQRALLYVSLAESRVRSWRMPLEGEAYSGIWARRYYSDGARILELEQEGAAPPPPGTPER